MKLRPRSDASVHAAELVDVSAGGLCARSAPPWALVAGTAVDVEIRLRQLERSAVTLSGTGVVVRIRSDGPVDHAALQFTEPLVLSEPFAHLV